LSFNENWSAHGFLVTGDDFGSSHNTIDDGSADYFYMRRFYVRHENANGKTELGIIPTYKGAVSSSGLSKDGWIKRVRHVVRNKNQGAFEVELGQLDNLSPNSAIKLVDDLNYIELEYTSALSEQWSCELSLERMTLAPNGFCVLS